MFRDRIDAGRQLGELLRDRFAAPHRTVDVLVAGLPRGGVPVAAEVARLLGAPLDVILVRKLGLPAHHELAMGAIGEDGTVVLNSEVLRIHRVPDEVVEAVAARERAELERRARRLRGERRSHPIEGRTVVVVDDGIATGATARAACHVARARGAARVVLAVPVAPPGWATDLGDAADEYAAVETPQWFEAVGAHYADFTPVEDDEVVALLARADAAAPDAFDRHPGERDE